MKSHLPAAIAVLLSASAVIGCGMHSSTINTDANQGSSAISAEADSNVSVVSSDMSSEETNSSDTITLTYAEVNSIDSLDGKLAEYFKDQVEKNTEGSVNIDIQASGVLGAESDILDGMTSGGQTVDMARISCFALNTYGAGLSTLLSLPYTFSDRDHFWKFTETDLAQQILNEPADLNLGIRGLYFQEEGFRDFFFIKNASGINDISGRKIRVSNDPILTGVVDGLGASPTVISFNELYTSLQSGVVDGGDQPIALYESNAFNEVAPYVLLDQHTLSASEVVYAEEAWNQLSSQQQEAITKAGEATSEYAKTLSEQEENDSMSRLKEKGVTFVEVPDIQPYRDACADIINQYTKGHEAEYQTITDLAK